MYFSIIIFIIHHLQFNNLLFTFTVIKWYSRERRRSCGVLCSEEWGVWLCVLMVDVRYFIGFYGPRFSVFPCVVACSMFR
jgi:hypothetical protein